MKTIKTETKYCISCNCIHPIKTIEKEETSNIKDKLIRYKAQYEYCSNNDTLLQNEKLINLNEISLKDAYKKEIGLLTSKEIMQIRNKYAMSQKDLSNILGWGEKTITRYESFQIQDKAHNEILKKVNDDPQWLLELINRCNKLEDEKYLIYTLNANMYIDDMKDVYLRRSIYANYAKFINQNELNGNTSLDLDKLVDSINYFCNNCDELYKVKLMKLLWYADFLSYKKYNKSITGLVYKTQKMGALPICYDLFINLEGINKETIELNYIAVHFLKNKKYKYNNLTKKDIEILKIVTNKLGNLNSSEIIKLMHKEDAYKNTSIDNYINYKYSKSLSI